MRIMSRHHNRACLHDDHANLDSFIDGIVHLPQPAPEMVKWTIH